MNNLKRISNAFWAHFEPQLQKGLPVFFTFTQSLITELIRNEFSIQSGQEAMSFFVDNAKELLVVQNSRIGILDETFEKSENDKSLCIVVIALQVLAAEKMTKFENDFSENAYYPPLRKLISPELGVDRVNPFAIDEFTKLWDTFKQEVLSYPNQFYITFDIEKKGASKYKIYPLSQALLNHKDLLVLANEYFENNQRYTYQGIFDWRMFLINNSKKISSRGARCVLNSNLKDPLEDQFKLFLQVFTPEQVIQMHSDILKLKSSFEIRLFPEESIFDNKFSYRAEFECDGSRLDEYSGVDRVVSFLESNSYMTVFRETGTYYGEPKKFHEKHIQEIGFLSFDDKFFKVIEATLKIDNLNFEMMELDNCGIVKFYYLNDPRVLDCFVHIIRAKLSSNIVFSKLSFLGGILFDRRGNNYFSEYAPKKICYEGKELSDSDVLICNNVPTKYKDLLKLWELSHDMQYELVFKNESKKIFLKSIMNRISHPVGNPVSSNVLSLIKKRVNPEGAYVFGFATQNIFNLVSITQFDFTQFFISEDSHFINLDTESLERLIYSIEKSSSLGLSHKTYAKLFLLKNKKAPKHLVEKLKSA